MTQSLIVSTSSHCLYMITQISPLRPQRPRSQVLNQIGGDRRLSVSPGPPSSSSNSSSSGPPPITPRNKLSFSLHTVSSKSNLSSHSHSNTYSVKRLCLLWTVDLKISVGPLCLPLTLLCLLHHCYNMPW